ncbi:hypothetical protein GOODEAATRI_003208 [Goodea atripinnis]|uniref:Uncharacterized protein n=1 Tax=Goodea atripinnis TaxID=208336 RepID=A0ABV0P112_9TELE
MSKCADGTDRVVTPTTVSYDAIISILANDSEAKQPQANKEAEKGKTKAAADPASPQKQPEQLPAAVGHSTPARKEQWGKTGRTTGISRDRTYDPPWEHALTEQQEEDQESHRSSTSRLSRSPLRGVKKVKMMQCKIALLDGSDYTVNMEVSRCRWWR